MTEKSNCLVSVIIPTYNMGVFVGEAIHSALNQTHDNLELIVVDDGSTDHTAEVVARFGSAISYVKQANAGVNAARNHGVRLARGEFLAFLDADDLWLPTKIERQLRLATGPNGAKMVGCGYSVRDQTGKHVILDVVRRSFSSHASLKKALLICQIIPGSGSGVLLHRSCIETVGPFDETLRVAEDWDMWLRVVQHYNARFVDEILVIIRKNDCKPSNRTLATEEESVTRMIEQRLPDKAQPRALAALHARLGRTRIGSAETRRAGVRHLLTSIRQRPFLLYPVDFTDRYRFPRVPRYYLLGRVLLLTMFGLLSSPKRQQ